MKPRLSLTVFGAVLVVAAFSVAGRMAQRRPMTVAGGSLLAFLPLVELVQPLSFAVAVGAGSLVLCVIAGLSPSRIYRAALRLWPLGMQQTYLDATSA